MEHPRLSIAPTKVDGLSIFYRETGPKDAQLFCCFMGFRRRRACSAPTGEAWVRGFHLIAPDYPGFGHSDCPDAEGVLRTPLRQHRQGDGSLHRGRRSLNRYTLYMQDYGGPVGFRMALAHPDRVDALIVQDAVAHNEGLGANWKTRRAFWADRAANEIRRCERTCSRWRQRARVTWERPERIEKYDPDLWTDEYAFLNKPGEADIQSDLFYDYRTNVDAYPKWQEWMRKTQPRLLVLWGKYDLSFELTEPEALPTGYSQSPSSRAGCRALRVGHGSR